MTVEPVTVEPVADVPARPLMVGFGCTCLIGALAELGLLAATDDASSALFFLGMGLAFSGLFWAFGRSGMRAHLEQLDVAPAPGSGRTGPAVRDGVILGASTVLALVAVQALAVGLRFDGNPFSTPAVLLIGFGGGYLLLARDLLVWQRSQDVVPHIVAGLTWWQSTQVMPYRYRHWVLVRVTSATPGRRRSESREGLAMPDRERLTSLLDRRRAIAIAFLGWGSSAAVADLLLSRRPLGTAVGLLVFVVLYSLIVWLIPRSRVEHGWERAPVDDAPTQVDGRRAARFGLLVGSLGAITALAVMLILDRAFGGDGSAGAIGPGVLLGSGVTAALGARDLHRWQTSTGRTLLQPRDARRLVWTSAQAADGLIAGTRVKALLPRSARR